MSMCLHIPVYADTNTHTHKNSTHMPTTMCL